MGIGNGLGALSDPLQIDLIHWQRSLSQVAAGNNTCKSVVVFSSQN